MDASKAAPLSELPSEPPLAKRQRFEVLAAATAEVVDLSTCSQSSEEGCTLEQDLEDLMAEEELPGLDDSVEIAPPGAQENPLSNESHGGSDISISFFGPFGA